ncbi:hypothetical protein C5S42_13045 [Candidatus Methanomarinus sp.]|nr:hypothetical protein C5S42_13045 [ANME-2 cluster archaeon]
MNYKLFKQFVIIFLIFSIIFTGNASAEAEIYIDNFDDLDLSKWNAITLDSWQIISGTASSIGNRPGLVFTQFDDRQYFCEVNLTAKETRISNYAQVGFYFYYEDSDNYARIVFRSDNRGKNYTDAIVLESEGIDFTKTKKYINTSSNTSIEFNPNRMHHLKVNRLNKHIYVYFNNKLALTTEFKDSKPSGKVGFDVYACTGYFDNFYLRPVILENASGYISELNLTSTNPTTYIGSIYNLHLDEVSNSNAHFSLSKFGKKIDNTTASKGDIVSLNFENGNEGVNFKITQLSENKNNFEVRLEDIISASTDDLNLGIGEIQISQTYYQEEDIDVQFSVTNLGGVTYTGIPYVTIRTKGSREILNPEFDMASNESEQFNTTLKAPKEPGNRTLTVTVENEYSTIEKSVDYQVRVLNPTASSISANLKENNGICGSVTIESPFYDELVDWNTTAAVKVYTFGRIGKRQVYSENIPFTAPTFNIAIPYDEFYHGDGQYVVTLDAGGMQDSKFLEITGGDFTYKPQWNELPPMIFSGEIYLPLIMLLIGLIAAIFIRNYMHRATRSLPLDLIMIGCGVAVLAAALLAAVFIRVQSDMAAAGVIIMGIGIGAAAVKRKNSAVSAMLLKYTYLHDLAGMLLVFLSAGFIIIYIPEWSFIVVIGTLIVYYIALNLYRTETS